MLLTDPFPYSRVSLLSFFLILFEAGRIENEMQKYGIRSSPVGRVTSYQTFFFV